MAVGPLLEMGNQLSLKRSKSDQNWRRKSSDRSRQNKSKSFHDLKEGSRRDREGSRRSRTVDVAAEERVSDAGPRSPPETNGAANGSPSMRVKRNSSTRGSLKGRTTNGGPLRQKSSTADSTRLPSKSTGASMNRYSDPSGKLGSRQESIDGAKESIEQDPSSTPGIERLDSIALKRQPTSSRKKDPKITVPQRDLIKECWDTSKHTEFGTRIYTRYFQKRPDIRRVFDFIETTKPGYSWLEESREFNAFLHDLIDNLDSQETIELMSREWGSRYVHLRDYGFKPQFWVPFSEIMTTECLYLDGGVHPVADMIEAWACFITIMLGNMRDGFYGQLRLIRKQSRRRQSTWTNVGLMPQESSDRESSVGGDLPLSSSIQSGLDTSTEIYSAATAAAYHDYNVTHPVLGPSVSGPTTLPSPSMPQMPPLNGIGSPIKKVGFQDEPGGSQEKSLDFHDADDGTLATPDSSVYHTPPTVYQVQDMPSRA